jgi:hypothetical protein
LASKSYQAAVLETNPIAYWPFNETSGTTAHNIANDEDSSLDGTHINITLADTLGPFVDHSPRFNGTNSRTNIYSAAFDSLFDGDLGSVMMWFRLNSVSTWVDGNVHDGFTILADANNYLLMRVYGGTDNRFTVRHRASSNTISADIDTSSDDWIHLVMTWNRADDRVRVYMDSVRQNVVQSLPMGPFVGALDSNRTVIGAAFATGAFNWDGNISHVAFWDTELTQAQVSDLYLPPAPFTKIRKVIETEPDDLIGYWPLNEADGTIAINNEGTSARDGTYADVVPNSISGPDGRPAPLWDGSPSNYCDIYSASLASAFSGAVGTAMVWGRVFNSGVWTDGFDRMFLYIAVDSSNYIMIEKDAGVNTINAKYVAGGTQKSVGISTSDMGWVQVAITWDASEDEVKVYFNGLQSGSTQSGLGVWAGAIGSTLCAVGALGTIGFFSSFEGYLSHAALWTTALTASQIAEIYAI